MTHPRRTLDFRDHRRELHDNRYIYAVVSRRSRGLSIGVNLNPDKACNFDCPYCQVDRTVPGGPRAVDVATLSAELDDLLQRVADGSLWSLSPFDTAAPAMRRVNDIAFAGDGEPTACPTFPEAVEAVGKIREKYGLQGVAIHLLTNATLFDRARVQRGLTALDALGGEIWAKLDAGTPEWFARVDGTKLPFQRVLDNIEQAAIARPIVLQCLFPTLDGEGPDDAEIAAWADRVARILAAGGRIREVQVTTVARRPAVSTVGPLSTERLEEIAAAVRPLGVGVAVYPGLAPQPDPQPPVQK